PSDGKSPSLKTVARPIREIDHRLAKVHEALVDRWKEDAKRAREIHGKDAEVEDRPTLERIAIDDATMESLPKLFSDNDRGLCMIKDELASLYAGLDQYKGGRGNDRQNLLKMWNGDPITRDRVGNENGEPTRCPHPCLNIVGAMTPDTLEEILGSKGQADG